MPEVNRCKHHLQVGQRANILLHRGGIGIFARAVCWVCALCAFCVLIWVGIASLTHDNTNPTVGRELYGQDAFSSRSRHARVEAPLSCPRSIFPAFCALGWASKCEQMLSEDHQNTHNFQCSIGVPPRKDEGSPRRLEISVQATTPLCDVRSQTNLVCGKICLRAVIVLG